jgi:proteasome lid subunit RPN8/RPN11/LysM repeat protein
MASDLVVTMTDVATADVEEHCFSRVDVEVGGFLLGTVDGDSVNVSAAKAALTASSEQTHLTFTHEAWAEILDVMDSEFPGLSIVGWYHSHPGFGCFLSDYDIFIQENFFSAPGQHALVIDPLAGTWGRFVASDGTSQEIASGSTKTPGRGGMRADKVDAVAAASPTRGRRTWPVVVAVAAGVAVLVGGMAWFLGNVQGHDDATAAANAQIASLQAQSDAMESQLAAAAAAPQASASATAAPAPTPEPSATPTPSPTDPGPALLAVGQDGTFSMTHVVVRGDNLWALAQKYLGDGNKYRQLYATNPGLQASGLQPGQEIHILMHGRLESTD